MRFLVITHDYPPVMNPRAFRWSAVCEQLARDGHHVDVFSAWLPGTLREENGLVSVTRVGSRLLATVQNRLGAGPPRTGDRTTHSTAGSATRHATSIPKQVVSSLAGGVWKSVRWPDAACAFILPVFNAVRRHLRQQRCDALVSVSLPFSSHLAALWLKQRYPNLPWIVDIGDPFAFSHENPLNNDRVYGWVNHRAEAAVLAAADRVSVTTQGALDEYRKRFNLNSDKIVVVPPLLSLAQPSVRCQQKDESELDRIKMVYCGRFYRSIRKPTFLLRLLRSLVDSAPASRSFELHLYGDVSEAGDSFVPYRDLIGRHLFLHGQVARAEATEAMEGADVLVNIGNSTATQLPSKIVEYISLGKPILNIVSHEQDATLDFLSRHPGVVNIFTEKRSLGDNAELVAQLADRLPLQFDPALVSRLCDPYRADAITQAYLSLATGILRGRSHCDFPSAAG